MTRHMFISTHNYWFSRLALLSSLIVLAGLLLAIYTQLLPAESSINSWAELYQSYLMHGTTFITLFLTGAAWYLHRELSYKPFFICLSLLGLTICQYFTNQWTGFLHLATNPAFTQIFINLCMLGLYWWIKLITGPHDHTFIHENDRKYRLWAWIGFLLLFSQLFLSIWQTTSHANQICTDFPYCNGQLLPELHFQALISSPLDQDGLMTLYMLHRLCMLVTTIYLTLFSISFIFNRALGEMAILIFFFMSAQIMLGIIGWVLQTSTWVTFGHNMVSMLLLLTIISLLIELYRKYMASYQ